MRDIQFFQGIGGAFCQTEKGLKFINTVPGTGLDIGPYYSKVPCMFYVLELPGDLFFALYKTERSFAEIVRGRKREIIKPVGIVVPVFSSLRSRAFSSLLKCDRHSLKYSL